MKLTRPLCVLDCETATVGNEPDPAVDRIIQLYMRKLLPVGFELTGGDQLFMERNPGVPISEANAAIHGFTDEKVKDWKMFDAADAKEIQSFIAGCDLAGFNSTSYDIPLIWSRCHEVGVTIDLEGVSFVDGFNLFRHFEPRDLKAAAKFYCNQVPTAAHDARADVLTTIEVIEAQVERYEELKGLDVADIAKVGVRRKNADLFGHLIYNEAGQVCFGTKRNRGVPVSSDRGYALWFLRSDFPAHTKLVIEKILNPPDQQDDLPM